MVVLIKHQTGSYAVLIKHQTRFIYCVDQTPDWFICCVDQTPDWFICCVDKTPDWFIWCADQTPDWFTWCADQTPDQFRWCDDQTSDMFIWCDNQTPDRFIWCADQTPDWFKWCVDQTADWFKWSEKVGLTGVNQGHYKQFRGLLSCASQRTASLSYTRWFSGRDRCCRRSHLCGRWAGPAVQIILSDNQPQQGPLAIELPVTTTSRALLLRRLSDQSKYLKLTSPKHFTAAALSSSKQVGRLANGLYLKAGDHGVDGGGGGSKPECPKRTPTSHSANPFSGVGWGGGGGEGELEDGSSR